MTKLIAVIHHRDDETSLANARLAAEIAYDGVCYIHMEGRDDLIEAAALATKAEFPRMLVITNRLSMHPTDMILRDAKLGLDGSWCDNPGVSSAGATNLAHAINDTLSQVRASKPDFLFFGSVAFKTQRHEPDPAAAALNSKALGWITTTSGTATGVAPDEAKLATMKAALENGELAVASGITPDNADTLARHVDWVLVSTGISKSFYEFDEDLMKALKTATAG